MNSNIRFLIKQEKGTTEINPPYLIVIAIAISHNNDDDNRENIVKADEENQLGFLIIGQIQIEINYLSTCGYFKALNYGVSVSETAF